MKFNVLPLWTFVSFVVDDVQMLNHEGHEGSQRKNEASKTLIDLYYFPAAKKRYPVSHSILGHRRSLQRLARLFDGYS